MVKKIAYSITAIFFILIASISAINIWPFSTPAVSVKFDNIIVFGDSLSDSSPMAGNIPVGAPGNNYWTAPKGVDYFVGAPITSNISKSNSNRYTWLNYLITDYSHFSAGRKLSIRRGTDNNIANNNVSYATASAETGDNYTDDDAPSPWPVVECQQSFFVNSKKSCVPGLDKQAHLYLQDVAFKPNANTLFVLWAGGNDFYQNIVKLLSASDEPLSEPIDNILDAVNILLEHNVNPDNIYVLNLPNFAIVPAIVDLVDSKVTDPSLRKLALFVIKYISYSYNIWLKSELVLVTKGKFSPTHVFSTEEVLFDIANNKEGVQQQLGISEPLSLTCTGSNKTPLCEGFFFFNHLHPTTKVHKYLAKRMNQYIFVKQ